MKIRQAKIALLLLLVGCDTGDSQARRAVRRMWSRIDEQNVRIRELETRGVPCGPGDVRYPDPHEASAAGYPGETWNGLVRCQDCWEKQYPPFISVNGWLYCPDFSRCNGMVGWHLALDDAYRSCDAERGVIGTEKRER